MSAVIETHIIETHIICDIGTSPTCKGSYGIESRNETAKDHRLSAKFDGWHYINGMDICPDCYAHEENNKSGALKVEKRQSIKNRNG